MGVFVTGTKGLGDLPYFSGGLFGDRTGGLFRFEFVWIEEYSTKDPLGLFLPQIFKEDFVDLGGCPIEVGFGVLVRRPVGLDDIRLFPDVTQHPRLTARRE